MLLTSLLEAAMSAGSIEALPWHCARASLRSQAASNQVWCSICSSRAAQGVIVQVAFALLLSLGLLLLRACEVAQ
jgi:hypothetical protein